MKTAKTKSHSSPPRATNPQAREDAFFAKTLAESSEAPGLMQRKPAFGSEEGAVQARLENPAAGPHASKDGAAPAPAFFNTTGAGGFFSKAGTPFFTPARVQAKLNVGQQDEPAEHEADTVADQVVQELSQGVSAEDEELLQGKLEPVQRQGELEKEELLQGNFESVQRQDFEEEALLQGKLAASETPTHPGQQENRTGMPDNLKAGIESLSGMSMDDVKVHKNSSKPAQLNALAYTQGTEIHVGPGQETHLPHEAWHAVQQMQGRVKPTLQAQGVSINDEEGLEHEADVMGAKALQMRRPDQVATAPSAQAMTAEQREAEPIEASDVPGAAIGASGEKGRLNFLSTQSNAIPIQNNSKLNNRPNSLYARHKQKMVSNQPHNKMHGKLWRVQRQKETNEGSSDMSSLTQDDETLAYSTTENQTEPDPIEKLKNGEFDVGISKLLKEVESLSPRILEQIDGVFSVTGLEKIMKRKLTDQELKSKKRGLPGKSLGYETGKKYTFVEGQKWSRLDFIATMSRSLGGVEKVLDHFKKIRKVDVPGIVYLHESAATPLENCCNTFGRDRTPISFVSQHLRGRHQGKHSTGMLMHPLGYSVDYDPYHNPMITDKTLHTLLGAVGNGPTHMELTNKKGKEISHSKRNRIVTKLGKETEADKEHDQEGTEFLAQIEAAYQSMVNTSKYFQESLGDNPLERQHALMKLKLLKAQYPTIEKGRKEFAKALEEVNATKKDLEEVGLIHYRLIKEYEMVYGVTYNYHESLNTLVPQPKPKDIENIIVLDIEKPPHQINFALQIKKTREKMELDAKQTKSKKENWEQIQSQFANQQIQFQDNLMVALAPIIRKIIVKGNEAFHKRNFEEVFDLWKLYKRLTTDHKFIFGSSGKKVKDPSVLQLLELGFARQDEKTKNGSESTKQTSEKSKSKSQSREFNYSFIKVMMEHGFVTGATWKSSTDTMHFDYVEGRSKVEGSSPAAGLNILLEYLEKNSIKKTTPNTENLKGI